MVEFDPLSQVKNNGAQRIRLKNFANATLDS